MAQATLSRGGDTLTLPLIETPDTQVAAVDIGKPNLQIQETGSLNPRFIDQRSGIEEYRLIGRYVNSNVVSPDEGEDTAEAYRDARKLADFIKSGLGGNPITLNIDMPEYDTDMSVVPQAGQDSALQIEYNAGAKENVLINLGLSRVDRINGTVNDQATTPVNDGTGPIQITGLSNTVTMSQDIQVTRTVGRPNSQISSDTNELPYYNDRVKAAYDAFELSFQSSNNTKTQQLADMFTNKLASTPLTLDFNGLYGMGDFSVVPDGSQALRHSRRTGIEGEADIPTINLRRVR